MLPAIVNFTLSGAIMLVGILTLMKVSEPKEVVFATLPLFFGLHQFTQGFVWLGMEHLISPRALEMAEMAYAFYAKGFLLFWVPLAIWLIEPSAVRKRLAGALTVLGGLLAAYSLWALSAAPIHVYVLNHTLVYDTPKTEYFWLGVGYVVTTIGALILSSSIAIRLFGWLNFIGLTAVWLIRPYAFTSLWCFYAAVVSVLLYFYFVERRIRFLQALQAHEQDLTTQLSRELIRLKRRYPGWRERIRKWRQ
jgi:hypothetical protein